MQAMTKGLTCYVAVLLGMSAAGEGQAGSDMRLVPAKGELQLSQERAEIGTIVSAELRLVPIENMPYARFDIRAMDCAEKIQAVATRELHDLAKGTPVFVSAKFRVSQVSACPIIGEVVTFEDRHNRFAAVYGATLNPEAPKEMPGVYHGTTANGQPTIEVVAPRRQGAGQGD